VLLATIVCSAMAAGPAAATKAGTAYRFVEGTRHGSVWTSGRDARMEIEGTDESPARVEIWKDGGTRILVLDAGRQTYYDRAADHAGGGKKITLGAMTVKKPFMVAGAKKIRVDVQPGSPAAPGGCRPVKVSFSYDLELRVAVAPGTFPGQVEGVAEMCMSDAFPLSALPFGHGLMLVSGIDAVDEVFTERLAQVTGVPVRRKITVTRRIENGEPTKNTLVINLEDPRNAEIPASQFEVPAGYRFEEPRIVAPTREQ
jgi:hypothetical protein